MDSIRLENLSFYGYHGVLPEEQRLGQRFLVSLETFLDLCAAGQSDDLSQTLDYGEIAKTTQILVEGEPVQLLEHLATRIIEKLFHEFPAIEEIHISIDKPSPPLPQTLDSVGITLQRKRT
ncbi:MAG: dihydroneopterin aldolase [Opitutales bacterium]|nr:dihydroneopterin aldolase [Opitutales bacterium]